MMSYALSENLKHHAAVAFPAEACGFIVNGGNCWWSAQIRNVAANPTKHYEMCAEEVVRLYEEQGDNIVGVWHSHPSGSVQPSDTDRKYAQPGMRQWIVTEEGVFEWKT
jgi:desampylase